MTLPAQAINPATGKARVAIYLQDAHNIREGIFESGETLECI